MTYKYFFFDFDGMLFDTYPHITAAFVKTLQESRKIKIDEKEAYDHLKVSYRCAFDHFEVTEAEAKKLDEYEQDLSFSPQGYPFLPVEKILRTIKETGGKNFLYTNRNHTALQYLKMYKLDQYFEDFIIADHTFPYKPDPSPLLYMVEKHHLPLKDCVVVGDRSLDVEGAFRANMAGILYDVDSRIYQHRATHVIKRLSQLYDFIDAPYLIKNNYHTHTARCGHAIGKDEEYVIQAIRSGYDTLGFTDHLMLPDLSYHDEYFESIRLLKEKYQQEIIIKVGLECEYYERYLPYYQQLLDEKKCDYLIFGNHSYMKEGGIFRQDAVSFIDPFTDLSMLDRYYDCLKKALETKLFKYICHPDCFLKGYGKWDEHAIALTHRIGKLLSAYPIYAELSGSGIRSKKKIVFEEKEYPAYPFIEFYRILKQYPIRFVLGCDAHAPIQLEDEATTMISAIAKQLQLPIVQKITDLYEEE